MEPKRYWWLQYTEVDGFAEISTEDVIDYHPFIYMKSIRNDNEGSIYMLENWKLISAEEYAMWKELNEAE